MVCDRSANVCTNTGALGTIIDVITIAIPQKLGVVARLRIVSPLESGSTDKEVIRGW